MAWRRSSVRARLAPLRGRPEGRPLRLGDWAAVVTEVTLVGRRTELGTLASALDRARKGRSCVVVLGGAAGVGKTALLDEVAGAARRPRACYSPTARLGASPQSCSRR